MLAQDLDAALDDIAFRNPSEVNAHPLLCETHGALSLVKGYKAEIDVLPLGLGGGLVGTTPFTEIVVLADAVVGDVEGAARQYGNIE